MDVKALREHADALWRAGDARAAIAALRDAADTQAPDPAILADLAVRQFDAGEIDGAEATWRRVLAAAPDDARGHRGLGLCHRKRNETAEAAECLLRAHQLQPENTANAVDAAGQLRLLKRYDEALALYDEAARRRPDNPWAYRGLGALARDRGDRAAALQAFSAALACNASDIWNHIEVAVELRALERFDEAAATIAGALALDAGHIQAVRHAIAIAKARGDEAGGLAILRSARDANPGSDDLAVDYAAALRASGALEAAQAALAPVIARRPGLVGARREAGFVARALKRPDLAAAEFRAAHDADPKSIWNGIEGARDLAALGDLSSSDALYREVLARDARAAHAWRGLAHNAQKRGDVETALSAFARAIEFDPENVWNHLDRVALLRAQMRFEMADAFARAALDRWPGNARLLHALGANARARRDMEAALSAFLSAFQADPTIIQFGLDLATTQSALGRYAEAAATLDEMNSRTPGSLQVLRGLGSVARERGDSRAALTHYRDALARDPDLPANYLDVAHELRALGEFDEAETVIGRLLQRDPSNADAHRALGMSARAQKNHERALEHFRAALSLAPASPATVLDIATTLRALDRFDEADSLCEDLRASAPIFAVRGLAAGARARRRFDLAVQHSRALIAMGGGTLWSYLDLASDYRVLGQFEEAENACSTALELEPRNPHALRAKALNARQRGDRRAALQLYREAAARAPHDTAFAADVAYEFVAMERFEEARSMAEDIARRADGEHLALRIQVSIAQALGQPDQELAGRRLLADLDPEDDGIALELIRRLGALEGSDAALAVIEHRWPSAPRTPHVQVEEAALLRQAGRISESAVVLAAAAMRLDALDVRLRLRIAGEARATGLIELASQVTADAAALAPDDGDVRLAIARLIRFRDGAAAARSAYLDALAVAPLHQDVQVELLALVRELGDFDAARAIAKQIELKPGVASRIVALWIQILCDADAADEALQFVADREAALGPRSEHFHWRADALFAAGDVAEAMTVATSALERNPSDAEALARCARYAVAVEDYPAAIDALKRQAKTRPGSAAWIASTVARHLFHIGEEAAAFAHLDAYALRYGDQPNIFAARAYFLERRGEYPAAADMLSLGRATFPRSFDLWAQALALDIRRGRLDEARDALENADFPSHDERARVCLLNAQLAMAERNPTRALSAFAEASDRSRPPNAHTLRQMALMEMFRLDLDAARLHLIAANLQERQVRRARRQPAGVSQSLLGQILDEYRIDIDAVATLCAHARGQAIESVAEDLVAVASTLPQSTYAAVLALFALRRSGVLGRPRQASEATRLPRRIVQFWDKPSPPDDLVPLMNSWKTFNPAWTYERFDMDGAAEYLRANTDVDTLLAFHRAGDMAAKADVFRLAFLANEGGVYIDADDRCLSSLDPVRDSGASLFGYQEDLGSMANDVLGAVPGHPVIVRALEAAVVAINRGDRDMPWLSTGPGLMTRTLVRWIAECGREAVAKIWLDDYTGIGQLCAVHCHAAYKVTPAHWPRKMFGS